MANLALKGRLVYLKPGKRFAYHEIQDSLGLCILHRGCTISSYFKYWIPRFVSETWILDSSRCRVGFRIP